MLHSETDWARVDALTDSAIDTSDIPALTDSQLEQMTLRMPEQPESATVRVDASVLAWFYTHGEDVEQQINSVLRQYIEAHSTSNP